MVTSLSLSDNNKVVGSAAGTSSSANHNIYKHVQYITDTQVPKK